MGSKGKKAVVLLSGGLDSGVCLAVAGDRGYGVIALTFNYGQRHKRELASALRLAQRAGVLAHEMVRFKFDWSDSSLLADSPRRPRTGKRAVSSRRMPSTYVPARNTIMLSLALAYAEVTSSDDIFFGANIHDYSGYPDCRPAYVEAFQTMANLAVKSAVLGKKINIHAPLMNLNKSEIIKNGLELGVRYELTHSCYSPRNSLACKKCSACFYRRKGFLELGVEDPTKYAEIS